MKIGWRRGRESNPSTRLCRPLHNRFATSPEVIVDDADMAGYRTKSTREGWASLNLKLNLKLEREKSLELSTSTLARLRSTN